MLTLTRKAANLTTRSFAKAVSGAFPEDGSMSVNLASGLSRGQLRATK